MAGLIDENDPHGLGAGKTSDAVMGDAQSNLSPKKKGCIRAWWLIPLILVGSMVMCCGICGGLVTFGLGQMKNNAVVREAVRRAEADPTLQQELGTPMEIKIWDLDRGPDFSLNQNGSRVEFDGRMGIYGPNGGGLLEVDGTENNGKYTFQILTITPDSTGQAVDLSGNPASPSTSGSGNAGDDDAGPGEGTATTEPDDADALPEEAPVPSAAP